MKTVRQRILCRAVFDGKAVLLVLILTVIVCSVTAEAKNCDLVRTGAVPLPDLGRALYRGFAGGLYSGGLDTMPASHLADGVALAGGLTPLDLGGSPSPDGKIVLISIGMSNAAQEFFAGPNSFISKIQGDRSLNPQLAVVNCAEPGKTVEYWLDPADSVYSNCLETLSSAGLSAAQVQAAWIKEAEPGGGCCSGSFPEHAQYQKERLAQMVRVVKQIFPHLALAHLSSRTRAYEDNPNALNPEPIAYETGFAVKWLIEDQLNGDSGLNYRPDRGPVVAPWLAWGPYLWIDGLEARSDGEVWQCDDTAPDGIHPSQSGVDKVSDQLLAFYRTDPTTRPWFLERETGIQVQITAASTGAAPETFSFRAETGGSSPAETTWNFGDGLVSRSAAPTKQYLVGGRYSVVVTVSDATGNVGTATTTIQVDVARPQPPTNLRISSVVPDG